MKWKWQGPSGDIEDRRGMGGRRGGGAKVGLGGILILGILSLFFGRDLITPFLGLTDGGAVGGGAPDSGRIEAEMPTAKFVDFVIKDVQDTWTQSFPREFGGGYQRATLVLFHDVVQSRCGAAESATGPFYCPGDGKVYIDLGFYDELKRRFGAPGEFAQAYVLAHEIGHHIQNLTGIERKVREAQRSNPRAANQLSVAMELQADCLAGVWGHSAGRRGLLETGDVEAGLNAAAAIGDDRMQKMATGRVMPERFTHGSSAQRVQWFRRGLESGQVSACETFR
jgi:uncharacterized protein